MIPETTQVRAARIRGESDARGDDVSGLDSANVPNQLGAHCQVSRFDPANRYLKWAGTAP